jgi:16S rRNA processing protein RimM
VDDPDRLVQIGSVGRPHGTDGAFVVEHASEDDSRWRVGASLLVEGEPATVAVSRRVGGGRRAIRLDRAVARGAVLAVRLGDLPPPEPDSFYAFQLVGLSVEDEGGGVVGIVSEVHPGRANDNLELDDGRLVPLIEDAIREVDVAGRRIVVSRAFLT